VEINVINLQKKIAVGQKKIKEIIRVTLRLEKVRKPGEITVSLVTDGAIRELNTLYLGRYCPTDVLSFDISRVKNELIADIAVSTDTALDNAKRYRTSPLFEVYLYVIHGLLHVLGYDDVNRKKRKKMQERATSILASLKIKKNGN
jgi:probable rRNA maturation factor